MEMLQVTDPMLLRQVLKVVNQIVAEWNHDFQELFSMVGLIPGVIKFAGSEFARDLRVEAGTFISRLCNSGSSSLQMLIACGGLEAIVDLISYDYYQNRDLVWNALDAVNTVKNKKSSHSRDLCRILAKRGLCGHLVLLIDNLATDIQELGRALIKSSIIITQCAVSIVFVIPGRGRSLSARGYQNPWLFREDRRFCGQGLHGQSARAGGADCFP